ncbi:hypothetical protein GCM10010129_68100 [Streptomyces fumigatiscleroticus]|nr:hypothetical protein GCM10010129_68100 [Streptomyces fumigatiscleroticus]
MTARDGARLEDDHARSHRLCHASCLPPGRHGVGDDGRPGARPAGAGGIAATARHPARVRSRPHEGRYTSRAVDETGKPVDAAQVNLTADHGRLVVTADGRPAGRLAFYRPDHALAQGPRGEEGHTRVDFVRGAGGRVDWWRPDGRLWRHEPAGK